jgi:hypothetical protein
MFVIQGGNEYGAPLSQAAGLRLGNLQQVTTYRSWS